MVVPEGILGLLLAKVVPLALGTVEAVNSESGKF